MFRSLLCKCCFLSLQLLGIGSEEALSALTALREDDECHQRAPEGTEVCGLNALQLRQGLKDDSLDVRTGLGLHCQSAQDSELIAGIRDQNCDQRWPNEARLIRKYMRNSSNRILLFGWMQCPCVGIAQSRFADANLCYVGRQWENPRSTLMKYLQCRENDPQSHSFIYLRSDSSENAIWSFAGNGFAFGDKIMSSASLSNKAAKADASMECHHAHINVNVYGTQLEECRVGKDVAGSWQDDGTCSEQIGGVHQICIEKLPSDFSKQTHQSAWSETRAGKRHCVCIGAWSLYMTDASKHADGAKNIMPHCRAIPETVFTPRYLRNWRDWNGYPASVLRGLQDLVMRCLEQEDDVKLRCGLKERFLKLQHSPEAKELQHADQLSALDSVLAEEHCLSHN
eukprot:TRINITY_DN4204_c0_g2_i1.p1 TRINITY_DN4204_c0_g2~~TRINITY_DN4204_c0_g2_i1.p1  ORF type:complete len:398 (-),score=60.49 TRINITY_DN4204_c0_g2_i1:94-1287(-)